jgi:hypothetical protein
MTDKKGQLHCQSCGSTSAENVGWDALRENDGYTSCCNERAVTSVDERSSARRPVPCSPRTCSHD